VEHFVLENHLSLEYESLLMSRKGRSVFFTVVNIQIFEINSISIFASEKWLENCKIRRFMLWMLQCFVFFWLGCAYLFL